MSYVVKGRYGNISLSIDGLYEYLWDRFPELKKTVEDKEPISSFYNIQNWLFDMVRDLSEYIYVGENLRKYGSDEKKIKEICENKELLCDICKLEETIQVITSGINKEVDSVLNDIRDIRRSLEK